MALAGLVGAAAFYLKWSGQGLAQEVKAEAGWTPSKKAEYKEEPSAETPKPVEQPDPNAERWLAIQRQLALMQAELMALKNKPQEKAPVVQKEKKTHASMLHIAHEPEKKASTANTYVLAPGATKLACQVETVINSDAGETFTAKTITPVYDTATGQHLLVPQNSTILGKYEGANLLYGNERLPSLALSLTLPNGETVDLGKAPVTNQAGTSGLVSSVDQHYWRLFGAIFIGGVLRGGALASQQALAGVGPAGIVGQGIAQSGQQVIQREQGRALDTRPTIHVEAGELCQVILTKPLQLAAVHQ